MTDTTGLEARAARLRALDDELHAAPRDERATLAAEHHRLLAETTGPYLRVIEELRAGDASSADVAIHYLEQRPRFHRSGYLAVSLMRALARADLDRRTRERFLAAVRVIAAEPPSRESHVARLIVERAEIR